MERCCRIIIDDHEYTYPLHTTFRQIADDHAFQTDDPIVLARLNGEPTELFKELRQDGTLEFLSMRSREGMEAYRRTGLMMMQMAFADLEQEAGASSEAAPDDCGRNGEGPGRMIRVLFTMDQAYYCEMFRDGNAEPVSEELLVRLNTRMREIAAADLPITKENVSLQEADGVFAAQGLSDRRRLFRYRMSSRVNLYTVGNYCGYEYGHLMDHTGLMETFELIPEPQSGGFFLNFPSMYEPEVVDEFIFQPKLFALQCRESVRAARMDLVTLGALNDCIAGGRMQEAILSQEAMQEHEIGLLAERILSSGGKKFVLIAGPSSSGKTTFSHRLSIQLRARGCRPHPIAMDDFFIDRDKMVRQPDGSLDFESIEALDVDLFNRTMLSLMQGACTPLPTFDFKEGVQKFTGRNLQIGPEDILVIEGIHGLNPILTSALPQERIYRIYISALSPLKMDEHTCLSTRDMRLMRRIVRDARTRGSSAARTLGMWDSVRRGEERHIFPFQEHADSMFNTALLYELPVLKQYVEPALYAIEKTDPAYPEARRLLKLLTHSLGYPSEGIAAHSILREFIGGSCFNV